ncbi:hypothetical protein [Streptomyces brasiliensis]|uniref:hypothetical protein n=1 Tax=Streptomyces brasiliensis TaxID=1954 RepID=UPI00166FAC9C|nr:hypothetical protein [Streptomyces brasiliensis]
MFVTDRDPERLVERALLLGVDGVHALRDVAESLSDLPDLVGGERRLLLSSGGRWRVELFARRLLVRLCLVDPLGDDGGVGAGFEGGL